MQVVGNRASGTNSIVEPDVFRHPCGEENKILDQFFNGNTRRIAETPFLGSVFLRGDDDMPGQNGKRVGEGEERPLARFDPVPQLGALLLPFDRVQAQKAAVRRNIGGERSACVAEPVGASRIVLGAEKPLGMVRMEEGPAFDLPKGVGEEPVVQVMAFQFLQGGP